MFAPMLALMLTGACGPALKQSQEFTPQQVKAYTFDDLCQLQRYFDATRPITKVGETGVSGSLNGRAVGEVTFVAKGKHLKALRQLLKQTYKRLPALPNKALQVAVPYYSVNGVRHMPIGASGRLELDGGEEEVELPYHPCLGAFFFGRTQYELRRRLNSTL